MPLLRYIFTVLILCVSSLTAFAAEGDHAHPRLLFDQTHVQAIRSQASSSTYLARLEKAILAEVARLAQHGAPNSVCYDFRPRHWAALYVLTGDRQYADKAAAVCRTIAGDTRFYNDHRSKGLTRAAGLLTLTLAYDLCYAAWDDETCALINRKMREGADGLMASMGRGANTRIANNWQGVRYGAAGLAYLAVDDEADAQAGARKAYGLMKRHIAANYAANGWCPEGLGYIYYPWLFMGPFGIAAARDGMGDIRQQLPVTQKILWTLYAGTISADTAGGRGLRADLSDDNPHLTGNGTLAMAMWYAPEKDRAAFRWMHAYLLPERMDVVAGGGIYHLAFFDEMVKEQTNPAAGPGLTYLDTQQGVAIFRNRFQDAEDIAVLVNARSRQPRGCHAGADTNTFRVTGLGTAWVVGSGRTGDPRGQTNLFPATIPKRSTGGLGTLHKTTFLPTGGGSADLSGSCMGVQGHQRQVLVDFSPASGAQAVIVSTETSRNGRIWRLNTPEFHQLSTDSNTFTLQSPDGAKLIGHVVYPQTPTFRQGEFLRGGGSGVSYKSKRYPKNTWIEFDTDGDVCVVMMLVRGAAPEVKIVPALHGAAGTIGDLTFAYDRQAARSYLNTTADACDVMERKAPMLIRDLACAVIAPTEIKLTWEAPRTPIEKMRLTRRNEQEGTEVFFDIDSTRNTYTDTGLLPDTDYSYQLRGVSPAGMSEPTAPAAARTWPKGTAVVSLPFAAPPTRPIWHMGPDGKSRLQRSVDSNGITVLSTPSLPIRSHQITYTEGIRMDLSSPLAEVRYDVRSNAVTVFSFLLKLSDGRWVRGAERYVKDAKRRWRRQTLTPSNQKNWEEIEVRTGRTLNKEVKLTAQDLQDVRGVGIDIRWVIHSKWIRVTDVAVRGIPLEMGSER